MMEKQDNGQAVCVNRKSVMEFQNHGYGNDRCQGVAEQCCSNNLSSPKNREGEFVQMTSVRKFSS